MNRFLSEQEEREIEALFQQNRTQAWEKFQRASAFENEQDRQERLWHELQRKDKAWVKHVDGRKRIDWNKVIEFFIALVAIGAIWMACSAWLWNGKPWPR